MLWYSCPFVFKYSSGVILFFSVKYASLSGMTAERRAKSAFSKLSAGRAGKIPVPARIGEAKLAFIIEAEDEMSVFFFGKIRRC